MECNGTLSPCKLNGSILVIEEDHEVLHYMEAIIERENVEYIVANTSVAALYEINREGQNIEAIILDSVLPDASGISIARDIHEKYPNIPILFVTSIEDPKINNILWQHGLVYRKPIEEDFPAAFRRLILCANNNNCFYQTPYRIEERRVNRRRRRIDDVKENSSE